MGISRHRRGLSNSIPGWSRTMSRGTRKQARGGRRGAGRPRHPLERPPRAHFRAYGRHPRRLHTQIARRFVRPVVHGIPHHLQWPGRDENSSQTAKDITGLDTRRQCPSTRHRLFAGLRPRLDPSASILRPDQIAPRRGQGKRVNGLALRSCRPRQQPPLQQQHQRHIVRRRPRPTIN